MTLWIAWMQAVRYLRPACRRSHTFLWMVLVLMGLCCRLDLAGVTSYVRLLGLRPEAYHRFLHLFHSKGLDLDRLTGCWVRLCLMLFQPLLAGTRMVCLADGIKAPKEGRRMPAVKMLHQQSASNSKPEYIMRSLITTFGYKKDSVQTRLQATQMRCAYCFSSQPQTARKRSSI